MPVLKFGRGSFLSPKGIFIFAIASGLVYGLVRVLYYKILHNQSLGFHFDPSMAYFLLLSPLWEEIAFRGVLLEWLGRRMRGGFHLWRANITYANITVASAFAATHLLSQPPLNAIAIVIPAVIFGMVYEKYGSIVLCVVVHMSYNIHLYIY